MKNIIQICLFALIISFAGISEALAAKVNLQINHKLGNEVFGYNQSTKNNLNNSFELSRMEYYLSDFTIIYDGGKRVKIESSYMLITASKNSITNQIVDLDTKGLSITNIEGLEFGVGVPAPVNNDDPTKWPASHPLAPKSPSMHWGWASGYRFVALEGRTGVNLNGTCEVHALNNENYKLTTINTNTKSDDNGDFTVVFDADYTRALENIDISGGLINHGGVDEAVTLLNNFRELVFTPVIISSVEESNFITNVNIFPNPNSGNFSLDFSKLSLDNENKAVNNIKIYDNLGKLLKVIKDVNSQILNINIEQKGSFVIGLYNNNELLLSKNVVIE